MTTPTEKLPNWDLTDMYPGPNSPELKADIAKATAQATVFGQKYGQILNALNGDEFGAAIAEFDQINELMGKIGTYSYLVYAGNVTDPKVGAFFQGVSEKMNDANTALLFFTLGINKMDDATFQAKMNSPKSQAYESWLREVRKFRPHQLSDDVEKILHEKSVTGHGAWNRLYDNTLTGMKYKYRGKELDDSELQPLFTDKDPDIRKDAFFAYAEGLKANEKIFSLVTNTIAKDKEITDRARGYVHPWSARNLENGLEDNVVAALTTAVKDNYSLAHRYYKWKAAQFGKTQLDWWDRNAPLPQDSDRKYGWLESRDVIMAAYTSFSPLLGQVGKEFFDKPWIDAEVRPGKQTGAFAHPCVPSVHPYLLVNFHGRARDVMTLAHELGHGCHQKLAGAAQGYIKSDTPLTFAETASVFGEMLTFQELLKRETDPVRRKILISGKVGDMLNTVVRQISFHEFEKRVHTERRNGELTGERLGEIWTDVMKESLGPSIKYEDAAAVGWAGIPHFVHTPFYVYAYAFGDCLVNALYQTWKDTPAGFEQKYIDLLSAGGTKRHKELLAPFGLDAGNPDFWKKGLKLVESFIEELEKDPAPVVKPPAAPRM